jgi:hypothetical protein
MATDVGAEHVTTAKGLTLRLVLGAGHSVTSPDILLQGVEQALRHLMVSHSLAETTLPLADGWIRSIRADPYWSRSAKERAASFPTFCSDGLSPGAWEVVPDIPPPLLSFAACSAKSLPFYSDIWVTVTAHPITVPPPAWGVPQPPPPAPAIPKKTGGLVTDFFETDEAAGGMDMGMDLDTDTEFPLLSPPSGSTPGGDPMVTASPAVATASPAVATASPAFGAKSTLPSLEDPRGRLIGPSSARDSLPRPTPWSSWSKFKYNRYFRTGPATSWLSSFPWRACISELVARLQHHSERVRSRGRPDLALPHIRVGRIALWGGNSVGVCEFWVASQEATGMREAMEWLALLRPLSGSTIWLNSLYVSLLVSTEMVDLQRPRFNENMLTAMPWELPAQGWFTRDLAGSGCILIHTPQLQPFQVITDVQGAEPDILIFDVLARTEKGLLPRTSWLIWMANPAQAARLCVSCEGFSGSGGLLWSRWNQTTLMWKAGQAVYTALLNEARLRAPPPLSCTRDILPPLRGALPLQRPLGGRLRLAPVIPFLP